MHIKNIDFNKIEKGTRFFVVCNGIITIQNFLEFRSTDKIYFNNSIFGFGIHYHDVYLYNCLNKALLHKSKILKNE